MFRLEDGIPKFYDGYINKIGYIGDVQKQELLKLYPDSKITENIVSEL